MNFLANYPASNIIWLMNTIDLFYFYPIIILLGAFTSLSDINSNTIKNHHLLLALFFGTCVYFSQMIIFGRFIPDPLIFVSNLVFASLFGFVFYWANLWGAGDGKLFITYAFLTPSNPYADLFPLPCVPVFISIFILGMFALVVHSAASIVANNRLPGLLKEFNVIKFAEFFTSETMIISFAIVWVTWPVMDLLKFGNNAYMKVAFFLLFYYIINIFLNSAKKKKYFAFFAVCLGSIMRAFIQPDVFYPGILLGYLLRMIKCGLIFLFLNLLFQAALKDKRSFSGPRSSSSDQILPFAPFMFLGTLVSNTNFVRWVINFWSTLMK